MTVRMQVVAVQLMCLLAVAGLQEQMLGEMVRPLEGRQLKQGGNTQRQLVSWRQSCSSQAVTVVARGQPGQ